MKTVSELPRRRMPVPGPQPQHLVVRGRVKGWLQRHSKGIDRALGLLVTLLIALFCLIPLLWVFGTSLKPMGAEYLTPIELIPTHPTLEAYQRVIKELGFLVPLRNSFIVSLSTAVLCLVVSSTAAYAVARLRFRYKIESLVLLQLGAMIPPVVTIAPTFVLLKSIGLLKSLPAMIIPNVFYCVPLATWLLASYYAELPWELEDAAKVDGWKPFQIFLRVIVPLSLPGMFAAGMFAFIGSYGEFMLASVVTLGIEQVQTIPVAIQNFSFAFRQQWTWISAGVVLALIPVILIVLIFQRWVIRGLTAGSVKY